MAKKKGFVLYFDACRSLDSLSPVQRGLLMSALYHYAEEVTRTPKSPEETLLQLPDLDPATQMAFRFMADAIARDTEKWTRQQTNHRRAALERFGQEEK